MKKKSNIIIGVVVLLIVAGAAFAFSTAGNDQQASIYKSDMVSSDIARTSGMLPVPCALTIVALPQPASQTVYVGTNNFDFAHIQFSASASCNITLNKVVVGVGNTSPGLIPSMIQNLKAYNLSTNIQVGSTIATPAGANVIGSNLGIAIPAGGSITLAFKADVIGTGSGSIRLYESFTEAVRTGTTTQVGNGYQYYGQWMKIRPGQLQACVPNTWTQKADFGGTARAGAVGFSIGNKGYIGTGNKGTVREKDFWEYNPVNNTWTQKADFGGGVRTLATGFSVGTKGYLGTGVDASVSRKDFWEYNPATNVWTQKADFGGGLRYSATAFSTNTKGYVGTGATNSPLSFPVNFWEYNPLNNVWTQKANFGGIGRDFATGFSVGSAGYIGTGDNGFLNPGPQSVKDFWKYDVLTDTWTQKADVPGGVRHAAASFSIGSKGYLGTGIGGVNGKDFWEYNPATNVWTQKADFGGGETSTSVSFSIGNRGYVGTGYNLNSINADTKKDFWEYCP
jgi:N-acetylneuraminic acid mutarotase